MNVKFMDPFIDAANEVLKVELDVSVARGNLSMQKSALTTDDVTVLLSLVGEIQGVVLFGLSRDACIAIVSKMMNQKFEEFDHLAQSGIAELGNVITGQAMIKMSQAGYHVNISPPTLITGKGIQISTLDFSRIIIPLTSELGDITVHLALREGTGNAQEVSFVPAIVTYPSNAI